MNYKETLFFIAKCLTINQEQHNLKLVSETIVSKSVNWDDVVKVSTAHYVFPALYCNLKRANLLTYLPNKLVGYMKHITDLNRERNLEIIKQAKEINEILVHNNVQPIFLKGTAFLLQEMYNDPAERMLGDIDFLVAKNQFDKAIEILKNDNYERISDKLYSPIITKHYPRLFNKNKLSAVEIHIDVIKPSLSEEFNYESLKEFFITDKEFIFLGKSDQLALTILAKQYNDNGKYFKTISLRNSYDVFKLSNFSNSFHFENTYSFYRDLLNPYLSITSHTFNTKSIYFKDDVKSRFFKKIFLLKIKNSLYSKLHNFFLKKMIYIQLKFLGLIRFTKNKEFRQYYIKKISNS